MIVFPMAGLSSRFFKENYKLPKYMLPLGGKSVFDHVTDGFSKYFDDTLFVWITLDGAFDPNSFVERAIQKKGIKKYKIATLKSQTRGQAETVFNGLELLNISEEEPLTIFNVDTFRPKFSYPDFVLDQPGSYLETFIGAGKNWSNVVPVSTASNEVLSTSEKKEESEFCCTGLYHWESYRLFRESYLSYQKDCSDNELYVAPMYNYAIRNGYCVRYSVVGSDEVIFCGTPAEYEYLRGKWGE